MTTQTQTDLITLPVNAYETVEFPASLMEDLDWWAQAAAKDNGVDLAAGRRMVLDGKAEVIANLAAKDENGMVWDLEDREVYEWLEDVVRAWFRARDAAEVTDRQIAQLADEAGAAGDARQVELCEAALDGDVRARDLCVVAILHARVQQ